MFIPDSQTLVVNANDLGLVGNTGADVTTAMQTAMNNLTSSQAMWIPSGVYLVSASVLYPGNVKFFGSGNSDGGTVIRVISGSNLTTPVLCSQDWYNNSASSGSPVLISDLKIDGNNAMSGSNAHGLVSMNFWSSFDRISISNVAGAGFVHSAVSRNGTQINNTCVEAKIRRLEVRGVGSHGIYILDNGSACTDGFIEDCIVQNPGARGVNLTQSGGWFISGNHVYGAVSDGIKADNCFATRVIGNYIDGFGSGSSSFFGGISMNILDGRGSDCINNVVGFESSTATGPQYGINLHGNGTGNALCVCTGNKVKGGSQSGSVGYQVHTSSGANWKCYFHDNDAKSVATTLSTDSFVVGGDLATFGHIGCVTGNASTAAAGANAGTTPPSPVRTNCTDVAGQITFGTGGSPAAGDQVDVTFYSAYSVAPKVMLTPINTATQALGLFVSASSTTGFSVSCTNAPSASQANTVYGFNYAVFI